MLLATAETHWSGLKVVAESGRKPDQKHRIIQAIGLLGGHLPRVDERTHSQYYEYLSAKLLLPFAAYYPKPRNSQEEDEFRCTVLELLDPKNHVGDGVDGIFCKTRKGKYEVNLPLIELDFPHNSPNFQFIEDYWYWFWNWR